MSLVGDRVPLVAAKVKGLFKGFKNIPNIFVYKAPEMQIGYPTDVKHVSHIGWNGSPVNAPSWMSEFRTTSDFSSSSLSNFGQSRETSWASQDYDRSDGANQISVSSARHPRPKIPKGPKKSKRKKTKVTTESSSISSRASYATAIEDFDEF